MARYKIKQKLNKRAAEQDDQGWPNGVSNVSVCRSSVKVGSRLKRMKVIRAYWVFRGYRLWGGNHD